MSRTTQVWLMATVVACLLWPVATALSGQITPPVSRSDSTPQALQIITSIRPLALLVQDIAGDAAQVQVLLPSGASPHHYSLRISDMQRIERADLLLWLGSDFERFLADVAGARPESAQLALSLTPGLDWLDADGHAHDHDHAHGKDLHLWLSPANGRTLMRAIAERLIELRPADADQFVANLARAEAALAATAAEVDRLLAPVAARGFGVNHDGFRHFIDYFGLTQLAAVSVLPDQVTSARHMMHTVQQLQDAHCLIVETSEPEAAAARLHTLFKIPVVKADPLAINPQIQSYAALIADLGRSFAECLG